MANWHFYRNLLFPCCSSGQGEPLGLQHTEILSYFRCFHRLENEPPPETVEDVQVSQVEADLPGLLSVLR
jgi:hypothetical protein